MSYEQAISQVVKVVEVVGAGIMVLGGLGAFVVFASLALRAHTAQGSYDELRRNLGRCILLGLEVLIVADIVRTIIVDPTIESVAVLGVIVLIRILLSFSLEVEIDGVWPWRRSQLDRSQDAEAPPDNTQEAGPEHWTRTSDTATSSSRVRAGAGARPRDAGCGDNVGRASWHAGPACRVGRPRSPYRPRSHPVPSLASCLVYRFCATSSAEVSAALDETDELLP
jgi:uncharacterized membrane protein